MFVNPLRYISCVSWLCDLYDLVIPTGILLIEALVNFLFEDFVVQRFELMLKTFRLKLS